MAVDREITKLLGLTRTLSGLPLMRSKEKKLKKRYSEIYKKVKHKRETIRLLETEFGRGYFSILNQIEKMNSF